MSRSSQPPGIKRAKLVAWWLYRRTPLASVIDEAAERVAAAHCRLPWERYCGLKQGHPEVWAREAAKRELAKLHGWRPQPPQFVRWRKQTAPAAREAKRRHPWRRRWERAQAEMQDGKIERRALRRVAQFLYG